MALWPLKSCSLARNLPPLDIFDITGMGCPAWLAELGWDLRLCLKACPTHGGPYGPKGVAALAPHTCQVCLCVASGLQLSLDDDAWPGYG